MERKKEVVSITVHWERWNNPFQLKPHTWYNKRTIAMSHTRLKSHQILRFIRYRFWSFAGLFMKNESTWLVGRTVGEFNRRQGRFGAKSRAALWTQEPLTFQRTTSYYSPTINMSWKSRKKNKPPQINRSSDKMEEEIKRMSFPKWLRQLSWQYLPIFCHCLAPHLTLSAHNFNESLALSSTRNQSNSPPGCKL